MEEMDQMITDLEPDVPTREIALLAAGIAVIVAPFAVNYLRNRKARTSDTVITYEEFLENKDQYTHLYVDPSMN